MRLNLVRNPDHLSSARLAGGDSQRVSAVEWVSAAGATLRIRS